MQLQSSCDGQLLLAPFVDPQEILLFLQKEVFYVLKQGLANYCPWANSSPLPVLIVLWEHSHVHLFTYCARCFHATAAELSSKRTCTAHEAYALNMRSLSTPVLTI